MANNNVKLGCGMVLAILVGTMAVSWLFVVGIIWLVCLLLSSYGAVFDIRVATAVWLLLFMISFMVCNGVKLNFKIKE